MGPQSYRLWLSGIVTVAIVAACGDDPFGLDAECRGSGGVVFDVVGTLSTALSPFRSGDGVSGCLRLAAEAARPGTESSDPGDVLGFEVRVGSESWAGDGYTMVSSFSAPLRGSGIHFETSNDGSGLVFNGGSQQPSEPGGYYFLFHAPGTETTRITIRSGQSPFPEAGDGEVQFVR